MFLPPALWNSFYRPWPSSGKGSFIVFLIWNHENKGHYEAINYNTGILKLLMKSDSFVLLILSQHMYSSLRSKAGFIHYHLTDTWVLLKIQALLPSCPKPRIKFLVISCLYYLLMFLATAGGFLLGPCELIKNYISPTQVYFIPLPRFNAVSSVILLPLLFLRVFSTWKFLGSFLMCALLDSGWGLFSPSFKFLWYQAIHPWNSLLPHGVTSSHGFPENQNWLPSGYHLYCPERLGRHLALS